MKYLGLDIGDKRIGIAISYSGIMASGVETYNRISLTRDTEYLLAMIRDNGIDTVVAGLPRHLNGDEHVQAEKNELIVNALRENGVTVDYFDERLTSQAAERAMLEADLSRKKRKENIDKLAAVIILQNYLDKKNGGTF